MAMASGQLFHALAGGFGTNVRTGNQVRYDFLLA